jgi:cytochrome c-type biogenesis protein CcmE
MTRRQKKFGFIVVGLAGLGIAMALVLNAFESNLVFFFSPSDVAAGKVPESSVFRVGGLVERNSVTREEDGLTVHFMVTDLSEHIEVQFTGILPDMFTEGQGVVVEGRKGEGNTFVASRVLAKHDETYMPPEVADALAKGGKALGPHKSLVME